MLPRRADYPRHMRIRLEGLIDMACPDCYWKRRFSYFWTEYGIDSAWARWKSEAPIVNEFAIPLIESAIEELRTWQLR